MLVNPYKVGSPFPFPQEVTVEGSRAMLTAGLFNVTITLRDIVPAEEEAFNGALYYGLTEYRDVPIFVLRFGQAWNQEVLLNIHGIDDSMKKDRWIEKKENFIALFLIEHKTGILKGMRVINIEPEVVHELKTIMQRQRTTYPTFLAVHAACEEFLEIFTIQDTVSNVEWKQLGEESESTM
jgi:hypothetical protein